MVQADVMAASGELTINEMIAMKEGLEAQIRARAEPVEKARAEPGEKPKRVKAGRFSRSLGYQDQEPKKLDVSQTYEVVANFVAVRTGPSLEAPFLRRLARGARVEMFEWDSSRCWRRVCVETVRDAEKIKRRAPKMTEAQWRWSTIEPIWAAGGWVDAAPRIEVSDESDVEEDAVVKRDAWVMVHHPELGLLLEAIGVAEQETKDATAGVPATAKVETQPIEVPEAFAFVEEKARFDFFWGNTSKPVHVAPVRPAALTSPVPVASPGTQAEAVTETPLMAAVRRADLQSVRALLEKGCSPNKADILGETPLFEAASAGQLQTAALLLLHGADPEHDSRVGSLPEDVAEDMCMKALLRRWRGGDVNQSDVVRALRKLPPAEAEAVARRFGMELPSEEEPHARVPSKSGTGGVKYRVVYKKVAVRKEPDTKSQALRQMPIGEIVEMFEWDKTHCWRRVRVQAIREADESGELQEVDGWMLTESPAIGVLLQEITEGDESDEDLAG